MADKVLKVNDFVEADKVLSDIRDLMRQVESIENERDTKIDAVMLEAKEDLLILNEQIAQHKIALEEFAEANKELFEKPRKRKLSFGTIGFKLGTHFEPVEGKDWTDVIAKLLKTKKRSFLRFKPSVNKDKLKNLDKKDLKKIGVIKVEEDHFSCSSKN